MGNRKFWGLHKWAYWLKYYSSDSLWYLKLAFFIKQHEINESGLQNFSKKEETIHWELSVSETVQDASDTGTNRINSQSFGLGVGK